MQELINFIKEKGIEVEFIETASSKTVEESSKFVSKDKIAKTLIFIDYNKKPFALIIMGKDKADFKKIKKFLNVKDVRLAKREEVLEYSGFDVGAVTPIYFKKIDNVLIDEEVLKNDYVYAGGGRENLLMKIYVKDILKIVNPKVGNFRSED